MVSIVSSSEYDSMSRTYPIARTKSSVERVPSAIPKDSPNSPFISMEIYWRNINPNGNLRISGSLSVIEHIMEECGFTSHRTTYQNHFEFRRLHSYRLLSS